MADRLKISQGCNSCYLHGYPYNEDEKVVQSAPSKGKFLEECFFFFVKFKTTSFFRSLFHNFTLLSLIVIFN